MEMTQEQQEAKLQQALKLIKKNITEANIQQNRDLHAAIQLIVDVARVHYLCMK